MTGEKIGKWISIIDIKYFYLQMIATMKYRRCNIITEYVCSKNGKRIISNGTKIIFYM